MKTKSSFLWEEEKPKNRNGFPIQTDRAMQEARSLGAGATDAHGHHYAATAFIRAADSLRMFRFSVKPGSAVAKRTDSAYIEHLKQAKNHINHIIDGVA